MCKTAMNISLEIFSTWKEILEVNYLGLHWKRIDRKMGHLLFSEWHCNIALRGKILVSVSVATGLYNKVIKIEGVFAKPS